MQLAPPIKGALLALLSFAIYSVHDVFIKMLGSTYTPFQIIFFAGLLGFPVAVIMLVRDRSDGNLRPRHPYWTMLRVVCVMATGLGAYYAFGVLPMAQVYALLFASPIMITILSVPMLGEPVGWRRALASAFGLAGVVVVLDPAGAELSIGHLAAIGAAGANALNAIIMRKIGQDERDIVQILFPMLGNFIVMGAALPFVYVPMPLDDLGIMSMIALLGFIAMLFLIQGYKIAPAVIVAPTQYSQIIWATVFGVVLFNETLSGNTLIGVSMVILSGIAIVWRENTQEETNQPVLKTKQMRDTGTRPRVSAMMRFFDK